MISDEEYVNLMNKMEDLERRLKVLEEEFNNKDSSIDNVSHFKEDYDGYAGQGCRSDRKKPKFRKDTTVYRFNDGVYNKRNLVLECVKYYVSKYDINYFNDLRHIFMDHIQGSFGIVKKLEDAKKDTSYKRYFMEDEDVIHLEDCDCVVSCEWNKNNIGEFVKLAKNLGLEVQVIERNKY